MSPRARAIVTNALGEMAAAVVMRRATGPVVARATRDLLAAEMAGRISPADTDAAFTELSLATTKVGFMSAHTDTPDELVEQSDGIGLEDDAALDEEIIGCLCRGKAPVVGAGLQQLAVGGTLGDAAIGAGLQQLAVGAFPAYLFTAARLSNPVFRRRLSGAIKRLSPKMRRRVVGRLRAAVTTARVSGAIRSVTPSIAGYPQRGVGWGAVSGWNARSVSVGRCPYASVAGSLTP